MNAILILLASAMLAEPAPRVLTSFESPADVAALKAHGTRLKAVTDRATDGRQALEVTFLEAEYASVQMVAASPWDFSGLGALAVDITNPGSEPLKAGIRVDDDPRADGARYCVQGEVTVGPGQTLAVALPLVPPVDPMTYGLRGLPPIDKGLHALRPFTTHRLELSHVVAWQVFLHRPKPPAVLILDHVRVVPWKLSLDGIVDAYGQYAGDDWPGKVHSAEEFARRRAAEEADLKAHPQLPDRDRFGGWTGAPPRKATGFFRTEKVNGTWWLITPDGHLFFSAGMDCVNFGDPTMTTGRENMFAWLPAKDDPLARHAGRAGFVIRGPVRSGETFNFLTCNLQRKYGNDYGKEFHAVTLARLRSWGFNTIANWSDQQLYRNGQVPYVATVHISGDHEYVSGGDDYWGQMHDPFDPRFRAHAARAIRPVAEKVKADPWCVGWFVDNELSWGGWGDDAKRAGLALGTLAKPGTSPAKKALLEHFKSRYASIAALNAAWGTSLAGWEALQEPFKPAGPLSAGMKADLIGFVKVFARKYFEVVREEIRKADPDHLYLGCRFAWHTPEAVAAANEVADVVSFNIYQPRLDPEKYPAIRLVDKPCIIGEFHFGALDRGMFHAGLVAAADQRARADMYVDYLRSVADHPNFVGCHWFQYVDQPLTGRYFDGENYNIGFISVTDTPYPEMVEAARKVHAEIYPRRAKTTGK
ncbi:MAG: beta-galactosidase [Phycisphaerae bacterium]|jgi:hypothetical protein